MSALSMAEIRARLKDADRGRRLVVSPILDPVQQLKSGQAAVDVRLSRVFAIPRAWTQGVAGALRETHLEPEAEPVLEEIVLEFGAPLIIHPHQFVLARTLEFVRLPEDLLAYVIGRSSWGRRGLIVATAVVVHPGFVGTITLELKNVGEVPLALYALDRVAQLTFHRFAPGVAPPSSAAPSQFAFTYAPTLGEVRDPATRFRLQRLQARRGPLRSE